jgi:aldehyde:ferredoxin oxidoreductase
MLKILMQYIPKFSIYLVDFSLYRDFWNSVTGIKIGLREFFRCGERIHVFKRYMNTREGISRKDDTLPGRMMTKARKSDEKRITVPMSPMLDQ